MHAICQPYKNHHISIRGFSHSPKPTQLNSPKSSHISFPSFLQPTLFKKLLETNTMNFQTRSCGSQFPTTSRSSGAGVNDPVVVERIGKLAAANAVVIFSISSCSMCHTVKKLFRNMGVSPTVYELDEDPTRYGKEIERVLIGLIGAIPVVFIGGKLVGDTDRVMACHINGTLVPLLREAGAIWL